MTGDINSFLTLIMQSMFPSNQVVVLADGSTTLLICGVGTIRLKIGIHILEIKNVFYVPRLDDTLFSITEFIGVTRLLISIIDLSMVKTE